MKRDYNADLFRILASFLVVLVHVMGQGGIQRNTVPGTASYWVAWFMYILAYCAVNCFALISGYVMVNKTTKAKNIIGLWFQLLFYSLLITVLFFLALPETRSLKNVAVAFIPVVGKQWWYTSAYFALFFLIPILNTAINHISKKSYEIFLMAVLVGVCILDCCLPGDPYVLGNGYSPAWLMVLYLVGAYIKKYDLAQKTTAAKSILAFLAMIILTLLSKLTIRFVTKRFFAVATSENTFISYTSITIVLASVFLFFFCLKVKLGSGIQKAIRFFAPATLGVYLIHVHPLVFEHIIKDAFAGFANKPIVIMVFAALGASLAIYLLCSAIDLLRIQLFKLLRIGKLCEMIDHKITKLSMKVLE